MHHSCLRRYHKESTTSRPFTEVKRCRKGLDLVLGWLTNYMYQYPRVVGSEFSLFVLHFHADISDFLRPSIYFLMASST